MVIDVHTHIGINAKRLFAGIYPSCQGVIDILLKMDLAEVDYAITFPFEATLFDNPNDYSNLNPTGLMDFPYAKENQYLLQYTKQLGNGRLLPFINIDPKREIDKQLAQIEIWSKQYQIFGIKVHTKSMQTRGDELIDSPFIPIIKKHNWPILFHSYMQEIAHPSCILKFALAYPDIRVGIAHLGGGIVEFYQELDKYKPSNVFIDTSPFIASCKDLPYDSKNRGFNILDLPYNQPVETLKKLMDIYGGYLMFGSDEPFTTYVNPSEDAQTTISTVVDEMKIVNSLDPEYKKQLTETNPIRFLGINLKSLRN